MAHTSPFKITNIRLFIAFRIFFNARFYYPVFTILFLDYGLSIEQFALLNSVWAVTIVCAEVPSGALADLLGRKRLLVLTSFLMIIEMGVIAFIPVGNMTVVFWAFLVNRVLSGLAEAMASGADEAIAYDSLIQQGNPDQWPRVLSVQMRLSSFAGIISMTTGALLYDPDIFNRIVTSAGMQPSFTQQDTMRIPVYLTLVLALCAFSTTMRLQETDSDRSSPDTPSSGTLLQTFSVTWKAGSWIIRTPFALAVILFGLLCDHVLRMVITLTSQYFREIHLPEASFGIIMASLSMLGLVVPKAAEYMVARFSPVFIATFMSVLTLLTLLGLTTFTPVWGIIPMALVMAGLMFTSFFTSNYLNMITSSKQRATVLSFKGLAFNLAYGAIGILFALLMQYQRLTIGNSHPDWPEKIVESAGFQSAIGWLPAYGLLLTAAIFLFCLILLRGSGIHKKVLAGEPN